MQDEARCHDDLDEQVKAIEASLPSSADQPGFELSYITRCEFALHANCYKDCYQCSCEPHL